MSATPEREQAEALDVLRDCYEQAVRKNWDSVNLATYDLRRALAAVSRLEAERDEWREKHRNSETDWRREYLKREAAVERERELTRALAAAQETLGDLARAAPTHHRDKLRNVAEYGERRAREALAGGVSAAGRPPEQDLGGNAVARAEVGEAWIETCRELGRTGLREKRVELFAGGTRRIDGIAFEDAIDVLDRTLDNALGALTAATALKRSHQEVDPVVPAAPEVLPDETPR